MNILIFSSNIIFELLRLFFSFCRRIFNVLIYTLVAPTLILDFLLNRPASLRVMGGSYSNAWLFAMRGKMTGRHLQILKADDPVHELNNSTELQSLGTDRS